MTLYTERELRAGADAARALARAPTGGRVTRYVISLRERPRVLVLLMSDPPAVDPRVRRAAQRFMEALERGEGNA